MLTINSAVTCKLREYRAVLGWVTTEPVKPKQTARERYRAAGLCLQCGGERPCRKCGAKTSKWRAKKGRKR